MPSSALKRSSAAAPMPSAAGAPLPPEKEPPPLGAERGASGRQSHELPAPSFSEPTWRPAPHHGSACAGLAARSTKTPAIGANPTGEKRRLRRPTQYSSVMRCCPPSHTHELILIGARLTIRKWQGAAFCARRLSATHRKAAGRLPWPSESSPAEAGLLLETRQRMRIIRSAGPARSRRRPARPGPSRAPASHDPATPPICRHPDPCLWRCCPCP